MGDAHARLRRPRGGDGPLIERAEGETTDDGTRRQAPIRVRDAATLVIVDEAASAPRILVGRRAGGHVFMPGRVVFPGGRLDPSDLKLAASHAVEGEHLARLMARTRAGFLTRRACALALAAIRETWEETGIMIGRSDEAFASPLPVWREFAAAGIAPEPGRLVPFARAITPPGAVRRYDTRFFAVRSTAIAHRIPLDQRPTDEFDRVDWLTVAELDRENLHHITRRVLGEVVARLEAGTLFDASVAMPLYRRLHGRFRMDLL